MIQAGDENNRERAIMPVPPVAAPGRWTAATFPKYKVLILPESQRPDVALRKRFARFLGIGGLCVFEL